jgi:hypothetical protein
MAIAAVLVAVAGEAVFAVVDMAPAPEPQPTAAVTSSNGQ